MGRHWRLSIRYHWAAPPSAVLKCGTATWKYSSAEAVRRSGVPLTNAVAGRSCSWYARTGVMASQLTERRMTVNANVDASVSTTSAAVSVTFSRRPVSACPTT
jgi:hypothetical protein